MNKKSFLITAVLVFVFASAVYAQPWDGNGVEGDPYQIWTAEDMQAIGADANYWDAHFLLMADVDLGAYTGTSFNIIGIYVGYNDPGTKPFMGVFDGNSHTISNFTYDSNGIDNIGLFGYIDDPTAEVKNLGLIAPNLNADTGIRVAALAGYLAEGAVNSCYIEGGSVTGNDYVGGLVGSNSGSISGCYSTGVASGGNYVGGLIGRNYRGAVFNCYSACSVTGDSNVGGLIGYNSSVIYYCCSTGSVSGTAYVGGLVGYSTRIVVGSFWDIETSGIDYSAAGAGVTTAQMQSLTTFLAGGWGGCGNNGIWTIDDGNDYPQLAWEGKAGVVISGELSDFLEGLGTVAEPYLIYNANQLNMVGAFPCEWTGCFKLMADIDLGVYTGTSFNIIGIDYYHPFVGIFDGNDHVISNFSYDSDGLSYIGLFGGIDDSNAEVKNLGLIDPNVSAGGSFGCLIGRLAEGSVSGCYVEGGSVTGGGGIGGLVGKNYGEISNSYFQGDITGGGNVGGLVGGNEFEGIISNCYSTVDVTGNDDYVGGLVGINAGGIYGSYSTASVTGKWEHYVGGLVGGNDNTGEISGSYSTGSVEGNSDVGGLVGRNEGDIQTCYSTASVTGQYDIGGLVGNSRRYSSIYGSYSTGSVDGFGRLGGLVGYNEYGHIQDCHSTGSVAGEGGVGGLVGYNEGDINNCHSAGNVVGEYEIGGLIGYNEEGSLLESYSTGNVAGIDYVGGVIGNNRSGDLSGCYSICSVTGESEVGGLIGNNYGGGISNCYKKGTVKGADNVGGLVGYGSHSHISNCHSFNTVDGNDYVGGLVGNNNSDSYILSCYSEGTVVGDDYVGGLTGKSVKSDIENCYYQGNVTGNSYVGGLAGIFEASTFSITSCYSMGNVTGIGYIGGLVGRNTLGPISNSYSVGEVSGENLVGGLVGFNNTGEITRCYSTNSIIGDSNVGGFVGYDSTFYSDYTACFWDSDVNPDVNGIGNADDPNVVGLPTVLMQTESTFTDAGWDFVGETVNGTEDIWKMNCEGMSYPKLSWWEPALGDFICPDGVNMLDFAILGDAWFSDPNMGNWDPACDISEPNDNLIDELDLDVFTDNYLTGL